MVSNDNIRISISGPIAAVEDLYKALSTQVRAERAKEDDGWRVTFDDLLSTSVEDKDIPAGSSDLQTIARERLIQFPDHSEKHSPYGPAHMLVSGETAGDERLTNWLRTLTLQHPVVAQVHLTLKDLEPSDTLFDKGMEYTRCEDSLDPETETEEFSA